MTHCGSNETGLQVLSKHQNISLSRFNGHFPGGPELANTRMSILDFIEDKDDRGGGDNCSYKTCKFQSDHHHRLTNAQLFTGRIPFLSPN